MGTTENSNNKQWISWVDGECHEVTVLSNRPELNAIHWVDGHGEDCLTHNCPWCKSGNRPRRRYAVAVTAEDGNYTWEMSKTTWGNVQALATELGGLRGLRLKVTRHGTYLKTQYIVIALGRSEDDERIPEHENNPDETSGVERGENGLVNGSYTKRHVVAADPQGAAAYAKQLAAGLDTTAREVLEDMSLHPAWQEIKNDPVAQLHQLIIRLEKMAEAGQERTELVQELDLMEMLA